MSRAQQRWTGWLIACVLVTAGGCTRAPASAQSSAPPSVSSAPAQDSSFPSDLPPLPTEYAMAEPPQLVKAVFTFAARHPEVLSRVPCFCGCERRGHRHNDDCFVAARDESGRVTAWEPHGLG